jgi:hypothetical protein
MSFTRRVVLPSVPAYYLAGVKIIYTVLVLITSYLLTFPNSIYIYVFFYSVADILTFFT